MYFTFTCVFMLDINIAIVLLQTLMYIFRWNLLCDEYFEDSVHWKNVLYIHWVWNLIEIYSYLDYGIYLKKGLLQT